MMLSTVQNKAWHFMLLAAVFLHDSGLNLDRFFIAIT
jgi:hypothetical protein